MCIDNLILVAGVRYDIVDQDTTDFLANTKTNQYDDALTPRVGIIYQPIWRCIIKGGIRGSIAMQCPECQSSHTRKNGKRRGKQNHICVD
ncbi:MAG: TonB-dependent receptor, partial [Cyanothece sp. SIO1E1]|nr:TonB-dependent receptor [Cyanothece sp. SIO1E1]